MNKRLIWVLVFSLLVAIGASLFTYRSLSRKVGSPANSSAMGRFPPVSEPLQRYPTFDAPPRVPPRLPFSVLVSLTMQSRTPDLVATTSKGVGRTPDGAVILPLECRPTCEFQVVLSAPGFDFVSGSNTVPIEMAADADSTPARFELRALQPGGASLEASFWYHGAFLAKVARRIEITSKTAGPADSTVTQPDEPAILPVGAAAPPDLTVRWEESAIGGRRECRVTIGSPYLGPVESERCVPGADLAKLLADRYQQLHELTGRGVQTAGAPAPALVGDLLRGLGRELYDHYATRKFRDAFWALVDKEKSDPNFHFRTIQIYTNNPVMPWEILVPSRPGDSRPRAFLGVDFEIARWHIGKSVGDLPLLRLPLRRVVAFAPKYQGQAFLAHQEEELQSISGMPGYERDPGSTQAMFRVLDDPPAGIVHFAGHGYARPAPGGAIFDYGLQFEDAALSPTIWRGHDHPASQNHPLFVLNACDTGAARSVAGFVDGWAPAVLEGGAGGFIGGLWPLGDRGAAAFSKEFYAALRQDLGVRHPASVARLLRAIRGEFAKTSDPTFLAYVLYGDARLEIVP